MIKERLDKLTDIRMLIFRLRGPCEYNIAGFSEEYIKTKKFWYEKDKKKPTLAELEKENNVYRKELEAAKADEYKELRKKEYPSYEELVIGLIENLDGDPTKLNELLAQRQAVKDKYPKERK